MSLRKPLIIIRNPVVDEMQHLYNSKILTQEMHSCYIGERNHTLHHDTHNHQPFLFSVIISNTTSYSLQIFLFHTFYWHSMSDNHHAGKQISMHQQHHPSACNNRGLVNQHEEDTIEASLEEENGDHEVRRIKTVQERLRVQRTPILPKESRTQAGWAQLLFFWRRFQFSALHSVGACSSHIISTTCTQDKPMFFELLL